MSVFFMYNSEYANVSFVQQQMLHFTAFGEKKMRHLEDMETNTSTRFFYIIGAKYLLKCCTSEQFWGTCTGVLTCYATTATLI